MRPGPASPHTTGFTLIEIMIVVGILGIILAIAAPTWMRQRSLSQQRVCQENLSKIDGAKEQWALNENRGANSEPQWGDLVFNDASGYLKKIPECPSSGDYTINALNQDAECSIRDPYDHNADPG